MQLRTPFVGSITDGWPELPPSRSTSESTHLLLAVTSQQLSSRDPKTGPFLQKAHLLPWATSQEDSTVPLLNFFKALLSWDLLFPDLPSFPLSSHWGQTCTVVHKLLPPAPAFFPRIFSHPVPFWCLFLSRHELMQQPTPGFQGLINLGFSF